MAATDEDRAVGNLLPRHADADPRRAGPDRRLGYLYLNLAVVVLRPVPVKKLSAV